MSSLQKPSALIPSRPLVNELYVAPKRHHLDVDTDWIRTKNNMPASFGVGGGVNKVALNCCNNIHFLMHFKHTS